MSPQEAAARKAAMEMKAKMDARPLELEDLKGKVGGATLDTYPGQQHGGRVLCLS